MFNEILEKLAEISSKLDQLGSPISWIIPFFTGTISGAFAILFSDYGRRWLFKPKLNLEFIEDNCVSNTCAVDRDGRKTANVVCVRVKVTNNSGIIAKDCRGYLIDVEKQDKSGKFVSTIYCDSIQLAWSCQIGGNRYESIDISKGVNQYLDVVVTGNTIEGFEPQIMAKPIRYLDLFREKGIFRFTIQVSAEGAKPKTIKLIFDWKGVWDNVIVNKG
jgi:hypothetical protein